MEGTCNECVFPLDKEDCKVICPTDTALAYAALQGKLSCVKELIAAGVDVNAACECHGNGVLLGAALNGHTNCLNELIAAGADVNYQNRNGQTAVIGATNKACLKKLIAAGTNLNIKDFGEENTALIYKVLNGSLSLVKTLISAGADVNTRNKHFVNPLMIAARQGDDDCLAELISAGAHVNSQDTNGYTALFYTVLNGHTDCVKELLEAGADVNKEAADRSTALMLASHGGHMECFTELIAAGAEISKEDQYGRTALFFAACKGHTDCVKELLKAGSSANVRTNGDETPLMIAVLEGHTECVKVLAGIDDDVNRENNNQMTPLMLATLKGQVGCLNELITAGAQINKQNKQGQTALFHAVDNGHAVCVKELLKAGAEIDISYIEGETALMRATSRGYSDCVKVLVDAGADVNIKNYLENTALTIACMVGDVESLKMLIAVGADVNVENIKMFIPLMFAARNGHTECLRELITAVTEVNKQNAHGETALILAANFGHLECVKELLKFNTDLKINNNKMALIQATLEGHSGCVKELIAAGADVNDGTKNETTALMFSALKGKVEILKMLLSAGAEVNSENNNKFNSLMFAAREGHVDCLEELIAGGADVNKQDKDNETALIIAATNGHNYCVKELLKAGTDINISAKNGATALSRSVQNSHADCVRQLLDAGANVNARDGDGNTVLMTAITYSNETIFQLLVGNGAKVNAKNEHGETALYMAVMRGHKEFERQSSVREHKRSVQKTTALSTYTDMVYALLKAGAHPDESISTYLNATKSKEPNYSILNMLAAAGGDIQETKVFLSNDTLLDLVKNCIRNHLKCIHPERNLYTTIPQLGLPVILQSYLLFYTLQMDKSFIENHEREFLLKAAHRNIKRVQSLIQTGVDVNVQDENGMTALMIASQNGHTELTVELLRAGANTNIQALHRDTALIYATINGQKECMKELLEYGVNVNIQGHDGNTALIQAARRNNGECLQALLDKGANVNIQDDDGTTALGRAASVSYECTEKLIKAGADINLTNKHGHAPIAAAVAAGRQDITKKLIESGASLNDMMPTVLMMATGERRLGCLKELIHGGADLNIKPVNGKTALDLAAAKLADLYLDKSLKDELNSAFESAVVPELFDIFDTLIKAGAEVNTASLANVARQLLAAGTSGCTKLELFVHKDGESHSVTAYHYLKEEEEVSWIEKHLSFFDDDDSDGSADESDVSSVQEDDHNVSIVVTQMHRKIMLGLFYEAGVTPDLAEDPKDAEVLKEMKDVIPISTNCPMTIVKKGRRYLATVAKGEETSLQGDRSDVKLEIKEGCPKRAYLMEVRTDLSNFGSIIPDDECFISPIVTVLAPAKTSTSSYILRIPHCLNEDDNKSKVKVRMVHENRNPAVVDVPKGSAAGDLFYNIDDRFIELHTPHFTKVICTICENPLHCLQTVSNYWFASFETQHPIVNPVQKITNFLKGFVQNVESPIQHDVEIRSYFGGVLHTMVDFRKSVEASVDLRHVTTGNIMTSRKQYDPESAEMKFTLKLADSGWNPRQGHHTWNSAARTFTDKKRFLDVINVEYGHRCRAEPIEAAIYSLAAKCVGFDKFRATATAQLTVDIDETSAKQEEKKTEQFSLELPVDFSKEKVAKQPELESPPFKRRVEGPEETKTIKHKRIRSFCVDEIMLREQFEKLPTQIDDKEISRLASLFIPNTLETVALRYFGFSEAQVGHSKANNLGNSEAFNRDLLHKFLNKGHNRKDLYCKLLEAESEGILDDVDMLKVDTEILHPV